MTIKRKPADSIQSQDRRVWMLIGIIAVIAILFVPFSQLVWNIDYGYTLRTVALGGAILGVVSGVLGCFAVLRRQSLMGDALSHAALPGVGIAFLVAGRELSALLIGAGIASWIGVQFIQGLLNTTRIKQDTAMGITLAAWFAAGIVVLSYIQAIPTASQAGLKTFIFGQAAAMVESDVRLISAVAVFSLVVLLAMWKEFKLIVFDVEFAGANGFRVGLINGVLSTLIVVAIVLGLQLAGVILMVGMLIAPGIAARQWTHKLDQMVILSAVFGAFAGGTGAIISAIEADIPTGPMIIVVAFTIVAVSILFAPGRGLVWTLAGQRSDRRRFASQRALRDLYRYAMSHGGASHPVPAAFIIGIGDSMVQRGLQVLEQSGFIRQEGSSFVLTESGAHAGARDVHNQQLWDVYRIYSDELSLPLVREDRQAAIEDILPDTAVARLEQKLRLQGNRVIA